ncbi:MAG: hypothetical protein ACRC8U_10650 [Brooklawnia sp.]
MNNLPVLTDAEPREPADGEAPEPLRIVVFEPDEFLSPCETFVFWLALAAAGCVCWVVLACFVLEFMSWLQ